MEIKSRQIGSQQDRPLSFHAHTNRQSRPLLCIPASFGDLPEGSYKYLVED
ncbi:hypothetical protein RHGRI_005270 [Rhododendron griersonianum]|uniref:Uncharacterized protein n=1 Tax=Rhododendron griersonianum TaxID=479676 RepID=A0AAV6LDI6_9ERIC|nr:hypothetical protein RHGRI_005270 [Rhododendron griersonianum]